MRYTRRPGSARWQKAGQILASVDAIRAADQTVRTADHRTVTLKGVAHPVEVASIDWQHAGP